ncbi:hypothetical protein ANCDUO_10580 [Ancylostoma duodenale]|uniref:Uncharacterized protein n=1 Tax=Ancylostoma duodenale TaxID=51022 RepID=A0A0C2GQE4_9BILA|nr:hypothetical protein ANCDUO_10580 [Ancylostoma duodenale]
MSLHVDLPDSMRRERVHIVAKGLELSNAYKLLLRYSSVAQIDVDAMGLFRSVQPCNDFKFGGYLKCTPPVPFIYNLR